MWTEDVCRNIHTLKYDRNPKERFLSFKTFSMYFHVNFVSRTGCLNDDITLFQKILETLM